MKKIIFMSLLLLSMCMQLSAKGLSDSSVEKVNRTFTIGDISDLQDQEIDAYFEALPEVEEICDECTITVRGSVGVVEVEVSYTASDCATATKKAVAELKRLKQEVKKVLLG